ncbi:MAG TPA: hypothetical protein VF587_08470 [Solirubrobacteraceae bacterium]|jgi:hypothetical protein
MGRRSRKRREPGAPVTPRPPRLRGEERDAQIREGLEPLAPGERPPVVTVAAIVCVVLLIANVGLWLAGVEVSGREPNAGSVVLQGVILLAAAIGMWRAKYWAVLGFQALLGLSILLAALALMVASGVLEAVVCLAIVGLGGLLFWKLIRALARLQMPERRPAARDI